MVNSFDPTPISVEQAGLTLAAYLRQRVAGNAYRLVRDHRLLGQHYRERETWYRSLLARLPQLNAELVQRVPELR